ncbi:MAG TPA: DUF4167 domain-containing protein [Rhizomicrobium sp.]|nr:DUF4167 domain-containing protein [Rhizomicrobium sp.]
MKRSRGRGRRPQNNNINPNRTFDSTGPEIKIRGSASHVYEKYLQLARDANSAGDRVAAENYLQHAEHYWRIMAVNQPQQPYQPHPMNGGQPSGNGRDPAPNGSAPSFSLADGGHALSEEEVDDATA